MKINKTDIFKFKCSCNGLQQVSGWHKPGATLTGTVYTLVHCEKPLILSITTIFNNIKIVVFK